MELMTKNITIPIDGSKNSLRSLDYLELMFGLKHDLKVLICYILPALPLIFDNDKAMNKTERQRLRAIEKKNIDVAERILTQAKTIMTEKGFPEDQIQTIYHKRRRSVTIDVCHYADRDKADTILLTRRGRTEVKDFFMGEVSQNIVEYCQALPVWILGGAIRSKKVLIGVDSSENALRAVEHAGFMLSGTDCQVTIFHTIRSIGRFIPLEVLNEVPEIEELWRNKAGQEITSYIEASKAILLEAGLAEDQISISVVDGSRSAANDIFDEANAGDYGTIVIGRRGISMIKEFFMGSVSSKVLRGSDKFAVWIVQ
ncbi:MAG: universal stress protein [Deltaproteobacteria bacterium]|nr:universal stress protein [Deltaproteobacteria bacterium]